MYIEKKNHPTKITARPTTLARLKKSCWIKRPEDESNNPVCRSVVVRVARTGGIKKPIEFCMYHPPTQKVLRSVRSKLFDGLCMGQLPDLFLSKKSSSTPQRGRKRARSKPRVEDDCYEDEPPVKKRKPRATARRPRTISSANKPPQIPGILPKAKAPGPGYCHNCKKARDSCIVCPNVRTHRFCTNCVARHFSDDYDIIFNKGVDCWQQRDGCPVCFWQCPCAACKRRMQNRKQKAKAREVEYEENQEIEDKADGWNSEAEEEEEQEAEEQAEIVPGGHATEAEDEEMGSPPEYEAEEMEEQEAGDLGRDGTVLEDEDEAEAGANFAGIKKQDSDEDDEALLDDDSCESNVEGHTHSEEDRREKESNWTVSDRGSKSLRLRLKLVNNRGSSTWEQDLGPNHHLCENDALEEGEEEEGAADFDEEKESRQLNWVPVRIMARRQRGDEKEYFVMWKDRWLNGDDTVSLYRRGELKEILKKRKRKRHPIEYLVRRKFSWEMEQKLPDSLLTMWSSYYQKTALLDERGKGKGKGEGWDQLWETEQLKRQSRTNKTVTTL